MDTNNTPAVEDDVDVSRCASHLTKGGCRNAPVAMLITPARLAPLCERHHQWAADILGIPRDGKIIAARVAAPGDF